jgi:DNA-binding transcriptional LysR family regulator
VRLLFELTDAPKVRRPAAKEKQPFRADLQSGVVNPELRHLRAFVALAEELNFTRAAQRLHLAQQALSAQIQQLEERVGAQLVTRTTRKVELTAAGEALYAQAPAVLAALEAATEAARRAARGETGRLRIGLLATAALDFTPLVLRAFAAERPGVDLSVRNVDFGDPTGGVRSGDTDVAVVWLPFATDGLEVAPLFDEERVALLADDHPLAEKAELRAADLAAEPMGWVEGLDPVALDFWTLAEHRGGGAGAAVAITGFDDYLAEIRAGRAVAAVPASIARSLPWSGLARRGIADLAPARVAVCRRADDGNPLVADFVRVAQDVAGTLAAAQSG